MFRFYKTEYFIIYNQITTDQHIIFSTMYNKWIISHAMHELYLLFLYLFLL